jgi:hypothetical protein
MKALKNFEAAFLIAAALATVTSFATAKAPVIKVAADPVAIVASDKTMPVVTVSAKRLSAAEKAALI